uniref:Uncharacterized protein n=1 Tax=Octopus bimaculoides TaxID=37653 RepID=A0A0L8GSZ3_OCTBM
MLFFPGNNDRIVRYKGYCPVVFVGYSDISDGGCPYRLLCWLLYCQVSRALYHEVLWLLYCQVWCLTERLV